MKTASLVVMVLVAAALAAVCLCGCDGSGGGGGGTDVALGANHVYTAGDSWVYRVTGTYTPSGLPGIAFGPAVATLTYDDTIVPLAVNTHVLKLSSDFAVGSHHTEEFRHALAFTQDGSGIMQLYGLTPHQSAEMPLEAMTPPLAGLSFSAFPTSTHWGGTATLPTLGDFEVSGDYGTHENVSTSVGTFETNRVTGTASLDGFEVTFTMWINPQLGTWVKMRVQWEEFDGSTMDMTFLLTSTTVATE